MMLKFLPAALMLAAAGSALAAPSCDVDPVRKKLYRLELTVPATYCMGSGSRKDPSCKAFPKPALQLHGLWPNYTNGAPPAGYCGGECSTRNGAQGKFCAYPEPPSLYGSPAWKADKAYMAGAEKCLERHEWVKHGICSPMKAPEYFGWSLAMARKFSDAVQPVMDRPVQRAEFDALIARSFPELDGAVHLKCKGGDVLSLYVAYEWGGKPGAPIKTRGGRNSYGNCGNSFTFPSRLH